MLKTPQGASLCSCRHRVQFLVRACRVQSFIIEELSGRLCEVMLAEASRASSNILYLHGFHSDAPSVRFIFLAFKR